MRTITKESFESLLGETISDSDFSKIKKIFDCLPCFYPSVTDIVFSYRHLGMDHLDHLFSECVRIQKKLVESGEISEKYASLLSEEVCLGHGNNCNDKPDEEIHEDKSGICQSVDMDMTKEHLEQLFDCTLTDNEYFSIKECYSCYSSEHDLFEFEDAFVLFFNTFGMDGIRKLNCHSAGEKAVEVRLREETRAEHQKYLQVCIKNTRLSSYITAFLNALVKFFNKILSDPLFSSNYNNSDYTRAFFISFINYLNKEIERFESEVK